MPGRAVVPLRLGEGTHGAACKPTLMELHDFLQKAAEAYGADGFPEDGDTLASFVQSELASVHDPQATDGENAQVMFNPLGTAIDQLIRVQVKIGMAA